MSSFQRKDCDAKKIRESRSGHSLSTAVAVKPSGTHGTRDPIAPRTEPTARLSPGPKKPGVIGGVICGCGKGGVRIDPGHHSDACPAGAPCLRRAPWGIVRGAGAGERITGDREGSGRSQRSETKQCRWRRPQQAVGAREAAAWRQRRELGWRYELRFQYPPIGENYGCHVGQSRVERNGKFSFKETALTAPVRARRKCPAFIHTWR